uniref:Uncharacterized protein n=1 Tax=Triticum urartu TaxID=4572 RepID=A0A8R7PNR8_TRIUA
MYFAGIIVFLLQPHYCFAGTILIICWNHVFCFQAGVALFFLLQPTSGDADGERRALGNQRSFQVVQAWRSRRHESMALFVFVSLCLWERTVKGKEEEARSDDSLLSNRMASSRPAEILGRCAGAYRCPVLKQMK